MRAIVQLVGLLASLISFGMWWPQALAVWKGRRSPAQLAGVSIGTQALFLVDEILWIVYAVQTGALWTGAPSLVNVPLSAFTIIILRRARAAAAVSPAQTMQA